MNTETFNSLIAVAQKNSNLSVSESFSLANECGRLLSSAEEDRGRELVIRFLENAKRFPEATADIWNDLIDAAGLFPYLSPTTKSCASLLRYEYHASPHLDSIYLHREQQK